MSHDRRRPDASASAVHNTHPGDGPPLTGPPRAPAENAAFTEAVSGPPGACGHPPAGRCGPGCPPARQYPPAPAGSPAGRNRIPPARHGRPDRLPPPRPGPCCARALGHHHRGVLPSPTYSAPTPTAQASQARRRPSIQAIRRTAQTGSTRPRSPGPPPGRVARTGPWLPRGLDDHGRSPRFQRPRASPAWSSSGSSRLRRRKASPRRGGGCGRSRTASSRRRRSASIADWACPARSAHRNATTPAGRSWGPALSAAELSGRSARAAVAWVTSRAWPVRCGLVVCVGHAPTGVTARSRSSSSGSSSVSVLGFSPAHPKPRSAATAHTTVASVNGAARSIPSSRCQIRCKACARATAGSAVAATRSPKTAGDERAAAGNSSCTPSGSSSRRRCADRLSKPGSTCRCQPVTTT